MKRAFYSIRHGSDDSGCEAIPTWCFSMIAVQPHHLVEMLSGVLRNEVIYCENTKKLMWRSVIKEHCVTVDSMEGSL